VVRPLVVSIPFQVAVMTPRWREAHPLRQDFEAALRGGGRCPHRPAERALTKGGRRPFRQQKTRCGVPSGFLVCVTGDQYSFLGQRQRTGMRAGPGPLEVVAAQPAGHVDHLADEVQPGLLRFHGLRRQIARVHAAQRHLGLAVALGAGGGTSSQRDSARPAARALSVASATGRCQSASCCTQASASRLGTRVASSLASSLREPALACSSAASGRSVPGARFSGSACRAASSWRSAARPARTGRGG
jgi:hypothetical protein